MKLVPDVLGMFLDEARQVLHARGFTDIRVRPDFASTRPLHLRVVSQRPTGGSAAAAEDPMELVVHPEEPAR